MRTEAELRRLMAQRAEPGAAGEAAVAAVVARLKEHGYLDDASFAETYARLRQENEKLGARRVRQELRQKGVRAELIEETSKRATAGRTRRNWRGSTWSGSASRKPDERGETARVMRRLVTAGFSTGTIYKILRQWDVPDEALAALEQVDAETHEE